MFIEELKNNIKAYQDFPEKGILFRDVLPVLQNPVIFKKLIQSMANKEICKEAETILAIDARGFVFGSAIAFYLEKPLILARKPGKLPGKLTTNKYELEYGTNSLSIQDESIKDHDNFVIIDDLLATGGTAKSVSGILKTQNKKVLGLSVVIELKKLKGKNKFDFPVMAEVQY